MSFLESVYQGILVTSPWEWIAVATGILYVIFAAMRNNICWFFAIASAGIFIYLCLDSKLYIESVLQVFYVVMAIVGWIAWRKKEKEGTDELDQLLDLPQNKRDVRMWPINYHIFNILISGGVAFILGFSFDTFTDQANPYADAFTTIFSLAATFMVVKKVLENWIYWIVIDIVSIFLYHERGLSLSAVLYFIFTILAIAGFIAWYKKYKTQIT